jgi:hypothetical protein
MICNQTQPDAAPLPHGATPDPQWVRQIVEETCRQLQAAEASPIIGYPTLLERLKDAYCDRTLRSLIKAQILPCIRPKNSKKLAFHWPSVVSALLRHQRGGNL